MKYCSTCGAQIEDEACFCPHCGCMTDLYLTKKQNENSPAQNVVSFLFPLIGLLLYIANLNSYPQKASNCGKWALIGLIANIFVFALINS